MQLLLHSYNDKEWHSASDTAFGKCEEKEGRRKSVWVLFSATTERQFQVKSDIRKFLRRESTFLFCSFQGFIYFQILPTDFSTAVYCACSSKLIEIFSHPQQGLDVLKASLNLLNCFWEFACSLR